MTEHQGVFDNHRKIMNIVRNSRNRPPMHERIEVPEDYFCQCKACKSTLLFHEVETSHGTCPNCDYHFTLSVKDRIKLYFGEDYTPLQEKPTGANPISFPDYEHKLLQQQEKSGALEALQWGEAKIGDCPLVYFMMDSAFMMASMGTYVGEAVTQAFEYAAEKKMPILGVCASGGARMQEGIFSLMQMAKTVAAVKRFQDAGGLYISLLTNPTFGGVSASFAMIGDINIAEPGALIGFAGPRVIRETIGTELPEGFQTAESLQENGFLDLIVERQQQKDYIEAILRLHGGSYE